MNQSKRLLNNQYKSGFMAELMMVQLAGMAAVLSIAILIPIPGIVGVLGWLIPIPGYLLFRHFLDGGRSE